jgi:MoaA/NifB/PqqE/SkfB family radical SAM enzyme
MSKMDPRPILDPSKFSDPDVTAKGEQRAVVALTRLRTLWFNTGSLCNLTCQNCYMESSPRNDRLAYMTAAEIAQYLAEIAREHLPVEEIGFTGGEPFMNPELTSMLADCLSRGYRVLILTNATKPLWNKREALLALKERYGNALTVRVSVDHFEPARHELIRGEGTWGPMLKGLKWLARNGFNLAVAGRTCWGEIEADARRGYGAVFADHGIPVAAADPATLTLFPEMDATVDVPEITVRCWDILGVAPETVMCATSRMVVKRKGAERPSVVPCTLLPYDAKFDMGHDLTNAAQAVKLNHPHCAKFCVLGGASCSTD